jgi:hypothetical protein
MCALTILLCVELCAEAVDITDGELIVLQHLIIVTGPGHPNVVVLYDSFKIWPQWRASLSHFSCSRPKPTEGRCFRGVIQSYATPGVPTSC